MDSKSVDMNAPINEKINLNPDYTGKCRLQLIREESIQSFEGENE